MRADIRDLDEFEISPARHLALESRGDIAQAMKSRVFVASSAEHLDLAYAVQEGLEHDAEVTVWSQGVFLPSRTTMATLVDQLDETDFAIFILAPDDVTQIRNASVNSVRDNVIFELGLFAGRLGPERCYMIVPRGDEELHLPTDLLGLTPALYDPDRQDGNLVAALGPACNRIRKSMKQLGPSIPRNDPAEPTAVAEDSTDLCADDNDCISIIQSWMGSRPSGDNRHAMRFSDIDRELRLAPGSARKHIKIAAAKWGYAVEREGKDTILFTEESRTGGWGY
ncbi:MULTISPECIES: TIR domain-containing protein [Sphingobium]|uniref:TIR domain-containing protein n=1 Tax=Sphingobium TaxID=165695 RepID=UPI000C657936|nr:MULTISPECIES: nucleotide-binding protein [Sphingobium]MBS46949.1 hypothetical protein [Sphingobium sp.]MCC4258111.1 nucleotide-binding protein [Sphingobium lactosutens]